MRSFYIVRKETKAFIKDWKSLFLLFITPIILVLIVGSAFILTVPTNVSILVCSSQDNEIYKSVVTLTNRSEIFSVKSTIASDCKAKINNAIRASEIKAGVIVSQSSNINTKLEVVTDNSKLISDFITSYFRIISSDISDRIVTQYIAKIYTDVESVKRDLNNYENTLIQQKNDLRDLRFRLSSAKEQLNFLKGQVEQFQTRDANTVISAIDSVVSDLNNFKSTTDSAATSIDSVSSLVQQSNMSESSKSSVVNQLGSTSTNLKNSASGMSSSSSKLVSASETIKTSKNNINAKTIETTITYLNEAEAFLTNAERGVNQALDNFKPIKQAILTVGSEDLPESSQVVSADIKGFFGEGRLIDFIFPSVLVMTLMLISTFIASMTLMRQRATGFLDRLAIAPGGCGFVVLQKAVSNVILSIIPIPFMIIIASGLLNLHMFIANFPVTFLILIVCVIIFVSIGMIIASFSSSESTAILAAIIIVIPMMFLSGIFIPTEKMPHEVQSVSSYLPLTLAVSVMEGSSFYNSIPLQNIAILFLYAVISLAISYFALKKTLIK